MEYLPLCLKLFCILLSIFGFVHPQHCNDQQKEINGRCCSKCLAGFYLKDFCSSDEDTVCEPCKPGFFSDKPSIFDRCEECHSCEQEYTEKCTATTDAKCSCRPGFLCSNSICSECEKDKCVSGEKHKTKAVLVPDVIGNLTKYTYECEPICAAHAYYDEKKNTCIPRTLCSAIGLVELFAGNKTHNAICQSHEMQKIYVVVIAGFVLLCLTIVVVFIYLTVKRIKKIKVYETVSFTATERCPLSREETGLAIAEKVNSFG